jgi:hypothetical protein
MDADSATHINAYAQAALEAYILWQFYLHNRTYSTGDAQVQHQQFAIERQVLLARLSDLTLDNLKRIIQKNSIRVKY